MKALAPLHKTKIPPKPGEWLAEHHEAGQSFDQWRSSLPVLPDAKRNVLYVQPIGDFTASERRIVVLAADYMHRVFHVEVTMCGDLPASAIPASARRVHPSWGDKQILTTYVLEKVLRPRLPDDAFASIAFTASDLWPGQGWNFVFGQASLTDRVGVWSIHRYGNPDASKAAFRLALLRTLKVAVHETGHMMSIEHCTAFECAMNGSNDLDETDRSPLAFCPEDMAKIVWGTGADPVAHLTDLAAFCREQGLSSEADFFDKERAAVAAVPPRSP